MKPYQSLNLPSNRLCSLPLQFVGHLFVLIGDGLPELLRGLFTLDLVPEFPELRLVLGLLELELLLLLLEEDLPLSDLQKALD